MARFTSLEFMEALGLGYFDYNGAKILLRLLQQKGIAKEVDRISRTGKGRKQVVYELPEEITLKVVPTGSAPIHPPKKSKKGKVSEDETAMVADQPAEVVEPSCVAAAEIHEETVQDHGVPQAVGVREYVFDEGMDDED